jgi:hypothetical protein
MKNLFLNGIIAIMLAILSSYQLMASVPLKADSLKSAYEEDFMLPKGITVASLHGPDNGWLNEAFKNNMILGSGGNIRICMTFQNSGSEDVMVIMPAGLTFLSGNSSKEKGILLQKVTVIVPANGAQKILLYAYCFNTEREYTRGPKDLYQFGSVLNYAAIDEVLEQAEGLKVEERESITVEEDNRIRYITATLQDAIYEVLEDGKLCEDAKRKLYALKHQLK